MRECFVTSFPPAMAKAYGRRMVESVQRHFGQVIAYLDEPCDLPCETRWTGDLDGWPEFASRKPAPPSWAAKPDNYIWDTRYAVKTFIWRDMARRLRDGVLVWLDGDIEATATPGRGFFDSRVLQSDIAIVGRKEMHPETGVVVFRLPQASGVIERCVEHYLSGAFWFQQDGWTDCHVLRACLPDTRVADLTSHLAPEWTSRVDAMALSPFGPFLTHYKGGARKRALCAN